MKKLAFLLLPLLFWSCSDDDDNNATIVGRWHTSMIQEVNEDGDILYQETYEYNSDCPSFVQFNDDGTYEVEEYDEDCDFDGSGTGNYSVSGDELTLIYSTQDREILTIISLSQNEAVLTTEFYDYIDDEDEQMVRDLIYLVRLD